MADHTSEGKSVSDLRKAFSAESGGKPKVLPRSGTTKAGKPFETEVLKLPPNSSSEAANIKPNTPKSGPSNPPVKVPIKPSPGPRKISSEKKPPPELETKRPQAVAVPQANKDEPVLSGSNSPRVRKPSKEPPQPPSVESIPKQPTGKLFHLKPSHLKPIVISMPENRKIDLIGFDIKKSMRRPSECILGRPPLWQGKEIPDLSSIPIGTPDWQKNLRDHLVLKVCERRIVKPKDNSVSDQLTSPEMNISELDLDMCDGNTDLDRLVFFRSVPRLVSVKEKYSTPGCSIVLDKDDVLMLHFPITQYRVHAVDADGEEMWIPIYIKQKFERLPTDPRHDDKRYVGTTALAEAKPLPNFVRVMEAHYTDEPTQMAEVDDIVEISHVEMGKTSKGKPQKVVVGKIGEQLVNLGEDLNYAEYSTMLSDEFVPMSELIKFKFPQRVRVVDTEAQIRNAKGEVHLKLLSFEKENHIICTQPGKNKVISIPLTCPIKLTPISGDWAACRKALSPLYPLVNHTWRVQDLGRRDLPENYQHIPQPIPEVIKNWMLSYEGKVLSVEVADKHIQNLKDNISDLKRENKYYLSRLASERANQPKLPPRGIEVPGAPPPARPPKPDILKQKKQPKPTPALRRSVSHSSTLKTPDVEKKTDEDDSDYEELSGGKDDDGYEIPTSPTGTIVKTKKNMDKIEEQTIEELKKLLEKKEEDLRNAKIKEDYLEKRVKLLEKDKQQLEKKNGEYATQIRNLQIEMDHALSEVDQSGENVYDSICAPPGVPGNNQIYSSPLDLRGVKAMTSKDVGDMLREVHLGQYVDHFEKEQVDGSLLENLEETILKEDLGMTGLHARKLMVEIKKRTGSKK